MMMMNNKEIENRIKFLESQIPDKKLIVEKALRELQVIIDEIMSLKKKIENINE